MSDHEDARATQLRQRFELAVMHGDAAACLEASRDMVALCSGDSDYVLLRLEPVAREEPAIRIVATISQKCRSCVNAIAKGETVWWVPGSNLVQCKRCGGGRNGM